MEPLHRRPLIPADPATVFISYSRTDEKAVLPIERALQARGVRVLRDKRHLPLGGNNVDVLLALIENRCDAILFYVTKKLLTSDFVWRYEIPAAIDHFKRDPRFQLIPILQGVSFDELKEACTDKGLLPLTDFNAERVKRRMPQGSEARSIATRSLNSALALRLVRASTDETPTICLRTFPYTPPSGSLTLDLDWSGFFDETGASPASWSAELLPALADTAMVLGDQLPAGTLDIWLKARLPAGIALGHAFPAKGTFRPRLRGDFGSWPSEGPGNGADDLCVTPTSFKSPSTDAIVEVAISREIAPAVTTWRKAAGVKQRWWVRAAPTGGPEREALHDGAQALGWARRIGSAVRKLWDREGVDAIHLFVAAPLPFAALVGQQLRDRHPVHVYYSSFR